MKWPWINADFVDDTTDISFILPEYYPKWDYDKILKWYINNKEYLTGKKENKDMRHTDTDNILKWYLNNWEIEQRKRFGIYHLENVYPWEENKDMNHKIKNAKNDSVKNMLDKWTSDGRTKIMIPKMIKHNGPATIVFWADGTKTVVKANPDLIEEKRVCYLDESGKRHYKTVTIDRTDDSAAVMYAYVKRWICHNEDKKFHHFLKVVESREEK